MKLSAIIIDDEPVARKGLQEDLSEIDFIEIIGAAEDAFKAMELIASAKPDLIFLDIVMPRLNGLELIKTIRQPPMVIITSAYTKYAMSGYELDVIDYLLKPIDFGRLLKACVKAKEFYELKYHPVKTTAGKGHYFFVKCDGRYEKIYSDELYIVQAANNYVTLHVKGRKILVYDTMKNILGLLPENRFLRVHKSFIVALDKIQSVGKNELVIENNKIPVSRALKETVKELLTRKFGA